MKVQNPLTGRSSGKFASAIFSTVYGNNIVRSKPVEVRDAKTEAQLAQREKFSVALSWIKMFLTVIRTGFATLAVGKSAYSAALSWYLNNGITGSPGSYAIDISNSRFVFGDISAISLTPGGIAIDGSEIYFTSSALSLPTGIVATDDASFIIYNVTTGAAFFYPAECTLESTNFVLPASFASVGDTVHLWIFAQSATSNNLTDDFYAGEHVVTEA